MTDLMKRFIREEEGQDLVEYALLLTLIALTLVAAITGLRNAINTVFTNAATTLS
jgi:Flp pilus assembly pilin Flp